MDCRTAEDLMAGLIDNELSPGHQALLEEHLQHCHACSGLLEQLSEQPLSPPPMSPMGDDFWSKMDGVLSAAIDDELEGAAQDTPEAEPSAPKKPSWRPSLALFFYAATLMFALGWGLYNHQQLQLSQQETAMLQNILERERRLSVQPVTIPAALPGSGYTFANNTPSRGTF
ncbi:MAG: zf-HC2 domain-containing protein [Myxococcota bacterium]|nr:zf-HC2 domain-containing protein [Myxococcota bacterium]